jgi:hypothetical protein
MAISATGRELLSYVVWICCLVVVISMATGTVRWYCSGSIVTLVAVVTTHTCVCSHNGIERVIEGGWRPDCLSVAVGTIGRELLCYVIGVSGGIEIIGVAASTGIGRIVIVSVMTCRTVTGNSSMCSREWVEVIMQGESGRCPTRSS